MKNLTKEQITGIIREMWEYLEICPPAAKEHAMDNISGFTAGWLCHAALQNDKLQKRLDKIRKMDPNRLTDDHVS